jgi:hypothetical protein
MMVNTDMVGNKSVAVLTQLADLPRSYGVVPVVLNQLDMLVKYGWNVDFHTVKGFKNHPDAKLIPAKVNIMDDVPFCHIFDYANGVPAQENDVDGVGKHGDPNITNFNRQVKLIEDSLEPVLKNNETIITHDAIFQGWYATHNQAYRNIATKNPKIRWIHWLHSGPSSRPTSINYPTSLRFSAFPNSVLVSPNETMTSKFAEMYNMPKKLVKVVYHTFDPVKFFDMHQWSKNMIEKYDLINCDALAVWATRIDHLEGKGMFYAMRLLGQLNKLANVKMLFLNSWSNHEGARINMRILKEEAAKWGTPEGNLVFSSEMGQEYELGVPKQVVRDMLMIGDMFIFPSQSETFSLSMIEASACKNMMILNEDLEVLKELNGPRADYFKSNAEWGGIRYNTAYDAGEDAYWMGKAQEFWKAYQSYKPLQQHRHVLKYYNNDWVMQNQLEPILLDKW